MPEGRAGLLGHLGGEHAEQQVEQLVDVECEWDLLVTSLAGPFPHGAHLEAEAGSTVAVHSTIHPATCQQLAARLSSRGATLVDAPVSGGPAAAEAGSLVVMVGGSGDEFDRCRPVFGTYGDPVLHVGPRGSALLAKLVNNALMMAQVTLADDALAIAAELGVDRSALVAIISKGSGNSYSFGVRAGFDSMDSFATVAAPLLRKDVDILSDVLSRRRLDPGDLVAVADHGLTRAENPSPQEAENGPEG